MLAVASSSNTKKERKRNLLRLKRLLTEKYPHTIRVKLDNNSHLHIYILDMKKEDKLREFIYQIGSEFYILDESDFIK